MNKFRSYALTNKSDELKKLILENPDLEKTHIEDNLFEYNNITNEHLSDFSCFEYEPTQPKYDEDEVLNCIKDLNAKNPELQVLKICELKYAKNLSVSEISKELDISEGNIVTCLMEIIDAIKD